LSKKRIWGAIAGCFLCFFVALAIAYPFYVAHKLPDAVIINGDMSKYNHSGIISAQYKPSTTIATATNNFSRGTVEIKYLGIKIKEIDAHKVENDEIYACGKTVGITLQSKGVVIVGQNPILTDNGNAVPATSLSLGDIICEIEGENIEQAEKISKVINDPQFVGKELVVKCKRNGATFYTTVKPQLDKESNTYKLGLWVRDDASGIGTLTYIKKDTLEFGALGHPISDIDTGAIMEVFDGNLYKCNVLSLAKGSRGKAGEIKGIFVQSANPLGSVTKNTNFGIFGTASEQLLQTCRKVKIGGRSTVKAGKAQILCCLDGKNIESFDIEIIKTTYQSKQSNKSLIFKVTDKDLIARTGGIIQGMSGSPIIQNGRLIGAVTHVFLNDATKGFGVYLDLMLNEN